MSCQQASRIITTPATNISNNLNHNHSTSDLTSNCNSISNITSSNLSRIVSTEDPYVFTESVPTTPPILFNTQKSRPRLSDITSGKTLSFPNVRQAKISLTNGKIAEIPLHCPTTTTTTVSGENTFKNGIATTKTSASIQNKKPANVCIVRPQLQQQQQQQQHQHQHVISSSPCLDRELKSISPPPLYTPTPSLWQTPLLIEAAPAKTTIPITTTTPASPLPPTLAATLGVNISGGGISNSSSTPNTTMTTSSTTTTTAMAKVAPIVVQPAASPSPPPPSCLPPSKFHSHTLAQHLQKVECLKKPKKSVQPLGANTAMPQDFDKTKLCDNEMKTLNNLPEEEELNDIPVNVIFRMALVPQQQTAALEVKNIKLNTENEHPTLSPIQTRSINGNITVVTPPPTAPASKSVIVNRNQPEINPSSRQRQQQPPQQDIPLQQQQLKAQIDSSSEHLKPLAKSKILNSKPRKSSTLMKSFQSSINNVNSYDCFTIDCSTPKGSVAIVKMSHCPTEAEESDISYMATPAGLPYCIQNYWMTSYDIRNRLMVGEKLRMNRSTMREERIGLYKQQLRRQAMQLLNTRSLQRLPLQMARRRLVCVDRLLRKYHKQNEKGLPANVKRCCAKDCKAFALEMSSYCQQHIALNAGQAIFLACTAKFSDNTQCRVPVFDITHDLPLCLEHARKRDAYDRYVCEQRPRKLLATASNSNVIYPERQEIKVLKVKHQKLAMVNKRTEQQLNGCGRKRRSTGNPVGRPQKRPKKCTDMSVTPLTTKNVIKRKNSTTSLESLASNSQHSTASSTVIYPQQNQTAFYPSAATVAASPLPPPALAPLSTGFLGHQSLPQHLFSFGHDNNYMNGNIKKHSTTANITAPTISSPTKDNNRGLTMPNIPLKKIPYTISTNVNLESSDSSFLNTNSNSNFTSSGMGSTTSLPTADDFLTQDMLSMCENSSVSSVDTGLGGLSDPELMLGGADEDDIPLGDTHLLEEQDLANVLSSLPEDAFKELFSTVHQDESDEIERAIELADKNLKTLQQTIGTDLGDFLDFSDDMLLNNGDICSSAPHQILDTSGLYHLGGEVPNTAMIATNSPVVMGNSTTAQDIRGLVHT